MAYNNVCYSNVGANISKIKSIKNPEGRELATKELLNSIREQNNLVLEVSEEILMVRNYVSLNRREQLFSHF